MASENTVILSCGCSNQYQDVVYGQGRRLHNFCGKTQSSARCTVCSKERIVNVRQTIIAEKKEGK